MQLSSEVCRPRLQVIVMNSWISNAYAETLLRSTMLQIILFHSSNPSGLKSLFSYQKNEACERDRPICLYHLIFGTQNYLRYAYIVILVRLKAKL